MADTLRIFNELIAALDSLILNAKPVAKNYINSIKRQLSRYSREIKISGIKTKQDLLFGCCALSEIIQNTDPQNISELRNLLNYVSRGISNISSSISLLKNMGSKNDFKHILKNFILQIRHSGKKIDSTTAKILERALLEDESYIISTRDLGLQKSDLEILKDNIDIKRFIVGEMGIGIIGKIKDYIKKMIENFDDTIDLVSTIKDILNEIKPIDPKAWETFLKIIVDSINFATNLVIDIMSKL